MKFWQFLKCLQVAGMILLLVPGSLTPAGWAAPAPMREMTVGVAVTPSFKSSPEWKSVFKKRLKYASSIFEREFRVKLKQVVFWDWTPAAGNEDMVALLDDLMGRYTLSGQKVDMIIGLTKLSNLSDAMNMKDLHVLGKTRPFSGFMMLRYPNQPLFRVQEETILVHEMGHLFGAVHTDKPDTIMCYYVDRQIPTAFDRVNQQILSVTRDTNFARGMESLPVQAIQELLDTYGRMSEDVRSTDFYYALAHFYLQLGQEEQASHALERLVELEPDNGRALYNLGVLYLNLGQNDDAEKVLKASASKLDIPGQEKRRAAAYDTLGTLYFRKNNMEGAQYAWKKALSLDPDNEDIKMNLAIVQLKRGQVTSAINDLQKALKSHPDDPQILTHLGTGSYIKKDYAVSVDYYQKALQSLQARGGPEKASPGDKTLFVDIYGGLGMNMWQLGKTEEATRYFSAACSLNPSQTCHEKNGKDIL